MINESVLFPNLILNHHKNFFDTAGKGLMLKKIIQVTHSIFQVNKYYIDRVISVETS